MAESGPLGVLLKASVGDAARFCASRDRQSTGNSRSKPHGPKTRASCVVVQNVPLGALISKRAAAAPGRRKCHPCLTEPPPQKAPDRRGGGARRVGSARARAARGWGQGAGAGCSIRLVDASAAAAEGDLLNKLISVGGSRSELASSI